MPYKDPERKRQWERDHRQERNARRRKARLDFESRQPEMLGSAPDPISDQRAGITLNVMAGIVAIALAVGMILIARWSGAAPRSDIPKPQEGFPA
jgi:hypothetical protein